jgi:2-hydroxy-6-oxonona-2,4-dienedioate hydrolase
MVAKEYILRRQVTHEDADARCVEEVQRIAAHGVLHRIQHYGTTVAWRVFGAGPPLLLLHGGFGAWTHWLRNVLALSGDRRLLVPDMPGFGDSSNAKAAPTLQPMADAIAFGASELGEGERIGVAGFSFGAAVAGLVAASEAVKVSHLVLVGAAGLGLKRDPVELQMWWPSSSLAERRPVQRQNLARQMFHDERSIDALALYLYDDATRRTRVQTRTWSNSTVLRDALPGAVQRGARLAGIWGEHDATAAPYLDERRALLEELQPGVPFHVIAGAGHWVQYEAADQFNLAMRQILAIR